MKKEKIIFEEVGQIVLDKIRPELINEAKDVVWNVYWQFGIDIDRPVFRECRLFWLCFWTAEQERHFERFLKSKNMLRNYQSLEMTFQDPTNIPMKILRIQKVVA